MEKVSNRKQSVLDVLDEQIEELQVKLKKVQPLMDELHALQRSRAALLDERRPTNGASRRGSVITMEQIILDLKTNGASTPVEIAERLGVDHTAVRSHLNRYRDQRYRQPVDRGPWELIGGASDDEEDDDE
jgi:hypothetical protein